MTEPINFFLALGVTILLSFLPERFLKPRPPRFSLQNSLLQGLIVSLLFTGLSLIIQRPVFTGIAILVFLTILVIVSNAKTRTLKEPMVFSDIAMFSQAFKHPRLYFPFLDLAPLILGPLIIIGLIILVLMLEPAMPFSWKRVLYSLLAILLISWSIRLIALKKQLSMLPEKDNESHGLLNSLLSYALQAASASHKQQVKQALHQSQFYLKHDSATVKPQANITVIQSESFFDARRLHPAIKQDVLKHYDQCLGEAAEYGKLEVPAWGANTMRSEFSFLSGLECKSVHLYQYYPYQYLADMPLFTLASALRDAGYYCVCIHPHPASFFGRDKIFPRMGFDEFIDIEQFDQSQTFGPYISDQAVTEKILEITERLIEKPLFIFAITMENHGPLHLEKVSASEYRDYLELDNSTATLQKETHGAPAKQDDLIVYLRHLKNADNMIKSLRQAYQSASQQTLLCFYGDHVPSMPKVYASVNFTDECSDYFIWDSRQKMPLTTKTQRKIASLASRLWDLSK